MRALDRKLLRDLWHLRGQVVTVALVAASAFAGFAGSLSTYHSLAEARDSFYRSARFGDVFADLKRAPLAVERRLAGIPGVAGVATRVVFDVTLDVPDVVEPVTGRLVGLPEIAPDVDLLVMRRGRVPQAGSITEAVLSEGFAAARNVVPGTTLHATINGRRERLVVVGIGLAPDYVYATQGGAFPDDRSFAVLWVPRQRLAAAYRMEGAFNHVSLRLAPGASAPAVIDAVDRLLEPYGGTSAYGRDDQLSHRILSQEINEWRVIGTLIPSIFLAVTAFLLNVVLSRQVATQREQIAALKALGYANATLAAHYLAQVLLVVAIGIGLGLGVGWWFGSAVTRLYADFFRFPDYRFSMPAWTILVASAVTLVAAVGGALGAVRQAVRLAPAEAMRPPFPGRYRPTLTERIGLGALLGPALRMTFRNLERRPWRAALTTLGLAGAMAIVISGLFWRDAIDYLIDVQFSVANRADAEIALVEAAHSRALGEVARLPGVMRAEAGRQVPARLVAGHRTYRTAIVGLPAEGELRVLSGERGKTTHLPPAGVVLGERLAERLGVRPGDTIRIEALTGERRRRDVVVAGTVNELLGLNAYMELAALARLIGEDDTLTSVSVVLDAARRDDVLESLKAFPRIATVASKAAMLQNFRETTARNVLFFTSVLTAFAAVIAVGVVYNSARITLQERQWELASLRVLGFTRREVSTFLLGELAFELAAALPLGAALGYALAWTIVRMTHQDMIAIPVVVSAGTYALAASAMVASGVVSALIVRARVDRLDLVAVLKTRE